MANTFINLPAPAANGPGAWVDTSAIGALRTVTAVKNAAVFPPNVTIEFSNNASPDAGVPLETFFIPGEATFQVAAHWMRAVVSNYTGGGSPVVSVGAPGDTVTTDQLPSPARSGFGTPVDVSALLPFKTIQVDGAFAGALNILISQDGGTTYSEAFSFQGQPGAQSAVFIADFMLVERVGVPANAPGNPTVWVAATNPPGGGGGGGGSIEVTDDTTTVDPTSILVFDPTSGFVVHDDGSDTARVTLTSTAIISTARYTADGSETAAGFDINLTTLGIAQPNANYNALVTLGGVTFQMTLDVLQVDNAPTHIHVLPGANLTAGDVLVVTIIPFVPV